MKDSTEFRQRFANWKAGKKVYDAGRPIPKYDSGTDDKTYLPEYEYEATVTPQGTSLEKHKRITNEEDWQKYWGNVGAGYVNRAQEAAAPVVSGTLLAAAALPAAALGAGAFGGVGISRILPVARTIIGEAAAAELAGQTWNGIYKDLSGKDWSTGLADNIENTTGWRPSEQVAGFFNPGYFMGGAVKKGVELMANGVRKLFPARTSLVNQVQTQSIDEDIARLIDNYNQHRLEPITLEQPRTRLPNVAEEEFEQAPLFQASDFQRPHTRFDLERDNIAPNTYDEFVDAVNNARVRSDMLSLRKRMEKVDWLSEEQRNSLEQMLRSRADALGKQRETEALEEIFKSNSYKDAFKKFQLMDKRIKKLQQTSPEFVNDLMNKAGTKVQELFKRDMSPELFNVIDGKFDPLTGNFVDGAEMQPIYDKLLSGDRALLDEYYSLLKRGAAPAELSKYDRVPNMLHNAMTHNTYREPRTTLIAGAKKSRDALEHVGFVEQENRGHNFSVNSIQMMLRGITNEMRRRMQKHLPPVLLNQSGTIATNQMGKVKFLDPFTNEETAFQVVGEDLQNKISEKLIAEGKDPKNYFFSNAYYKVPKEELESEGFQTIEDVAKDVRAAYKKFYDTYNEQVRKYPNLFPEGEQFYDLEEEIVPVVPEFKDEKLWEDLPHLITPKWITRMDKGKSIHINPANKGKLNATKKRTGKTTEQLSHSKNPLTRKRAIFALNSRKFEH